MIKRALVSLLAILLLLTAMPLSALAIYDTSGNEYITTKKTPSGKTGKSMTVSFTFHNADSEDYEHVKVGFSEVGADVTDDADAVKYGIVFPFEVTNDTFRTKDIGTVKAGADKSVTLTAKVRRDLPEGYYSIPIKVSGDNGMAIVDEYVNVWISKSLTSDKDEEEKEKEVAFVVGEDQNTPDGHYPNVMDFAVNLRNNSQMSAFNVTASIVLSSKDEEFPFEINEVNYDQNFEKIASQETVQLNYSMAIRKEVFSGYYPIKLKITFRDSTEGEFKTVETSFYVRITNKEKEDNLGDFNVNDRTKARIIVDGYQTVPSEIYAGEEFELIVQMKNASSDVSASNLLFTFESEKITDSAVFTTESGSSSLVVNHLGAGQTTQLRLRLTSKAGVDQRSYGITIKEKYDSPEFKNAEESVVIDIPIKQHARLNTGTIEVMPEMIDVGSETNVMFSINNTGKVMLYNVTALFEADSIQINDAYVGNIKPGESGNVDIMLTGQAPTTDSGKVKITLSYEDENGVVSTQEKELSLQVNETMQEDMGDLEVGNFDGLEENPPSFMTKYKNKLLVAAGLAAVIAIFFTAKVIKKKRSKRDEDMSDEIS